MVDKLAKLMIVCKAHGITPAQTAQIIFERFIEPEQLRRGAVMLTLAIAAVVNLVIGLVVGHLL